MPVEGARHLGPVFWNAMSGVLGLPGDDRVVFSDGKEQNNSACGRHKDPGDQQGSDTEKLQQLPAGKVTNGAAQGIRSGDEGLALDHVNMGNLAIGVVQLRRGEKCIGGRLKKLNEVNARDTGGHKEQNGL